MNPIRLLLLSGENASRGIMAEAFIRAKSDEALRTSAEHQVEVVTVSREKKQPRPLAVEIMQEAGIDISDLSAHPFADYQLQEFDVIITLCDQGKESCPMMPGNPERIDWSLPDLASDTVDNDASRESFVQLRKTLRGLVDELFDRGYLCALAQSKRQSDLILNTIDEGIIAHDLDQRLFYFNSAAEKITEFKRNTVIGRKCHEAFPEGFCGGKGLFCGGKAPEKGETIKRTMDIATRSGEHRIIEAKFQAMEDARGLVVGVLGMFHDMTREHELERRLGEVQQFSGIIGRDSRMLEIFDLIRDVAESSASVLIEGESGTGKELVAGAIHRESPRANRAFVAVNCGALPETLLESELFGHVRGAFTGAIRDKKGRFELANGGTIFLDEIGDISQAMQIKLLRVLQEGAFERVGSEKTIQVDVRVISATNKNLRREIQEGRFREDLYYRLAVVPLRLPPLRERKTDIPLLANHILKRAAEENGREEIRLSSETLDVMMNHDWPGNVRELQNWIQFALVKCKGHTIEPDHLPEHAHSLSGKSGGSDASNQRRRRKLSVPAVREALEQSKGNKVQAAEILDVGRATLYRFLNEVPSLKNHGRKNG
ncbi:MAG: sigma 54-interacting transcriptional regulator [Candidatus Sumerlaeia bacterium]